MAVTLAVMLGVGLAVLAFWGIGKLVGTTTETPAEPLEVGRTALTLVAGIGGAVALVVAYRRQRDIEQGRFVERFGAAATQLGDSDVAVRIAGVYAMATTADEASNLPRRQQCIDVLCGYLRLGFDPDQGTSNRTELVVRLKRGPNSGIEGSEEETHFRFRQNDRVVRETIVRVVAAHLKPSAEVSWSLNDFDFTGAYFSNASFKEARFEGRNVSFAAVTFAEGETNFESAVFAGKVTFENARFLCSDTTFEKVRFEDSVSFASAEFNGGGAAHMFENAIFNGFTTFRETRFAGVLPMFEYATFNGPYTVFSKTEFMNHTTFNGALFSGAYSTFEESVFWSNAEFNGVDFENKTTHFGEVVFKGESTSFYQSNFASETTYFDEAKFEGANVDFSEPGAWRDVRVAWDKGGEEMPACITPREWPPEVVLSRPRSSRRERMWMKAKKVVRRQPATRKPY